MLRAFETEIANMSGATSEKSILFAGIFAVLESRIAWQSIGRGCC